MFFRFIKIQFIIGLISTLKLNLVGELYVGEVIACAYMLINIAKLRLTRQEKTIIGFAFLWAIAQLLSDLFNKTEIFDAAKGVLAPIVFVISFTFLINYIKNKFERLPSLLLGITVGGLVQLILFPTEYFLFNFWKWGFGNAVLGVFVIYFSFFLKEKRNLLLFTALIVFLGVTLYFDSRGMAIFPILAALAYRRYYGKKTSTLSKRFSGARAGFKVLLIALPALFFINSAASALFSSEAVLSNFSSDAAAKYRTQATGSFGILLGGRSESLVSIQAFLDKPLLGHGSWAKDKSGYLDQYSILRSKLGYSLREDGGYEEVGKNFLIPSHSFLMGAMVWAGFMGGLFWLLLLNSTLKVFIKNLNSFPLYYYVGMIGFVWNVFFSPFGADARWSTAVFLAAFFSYSNYLKFNTRVAA